jgi:hypothetical protein
LVPVAELGGGVGARTDGHRVASRIRVASSAQKRWSLGGVAAAAAAAAATSIHEVVTVQQLLYFRWCEIIPRTHFYKKKHSMRFTNFFIKKRDSIQKKIFNPSPVGIS